MEQKLEDNKESRFIQWLKARLLIHPVVDSDPRLKSHKIKIGILSILMMQASIPGLSSTIYFPGIQN